MGDIERRISAILSRHNLSTEQGREQAYAECVEYAENELSADLRCNAFLRSAAQLLEREPVEYDVIRDMVDVPDDARLDISYDERQGFIITANARGLEYLVELLRVLTEAPAGEHVHLYNDEEPLTPVSFNALIYLEDDEWFDKIEQEIAKEGKTDSYPRRPIVQKDVFALQIIGDIPPDLNLTRDKIYKVEAFSADEMDESWKKTFSGDADRYVQFKLTDDNGDDFEIILHLDDADVNYFKKEDFTDLID